MSTRKTTPQFINESINKHGNIYDYTKTNYINSNTNVIIICKIHGSFTKRPDHHLNGAGCQLCSNLKVSVAQTFDTKTVIDNFQIKHKHKYDYSKVSYVNMYVKVSIICKQHGLFKQLPLNHQSGQGCPLCISQNAGGFKRNIPAILYYLKIEKNGIVNYKIGVTNKTVKKRFGSDIKYITVLNEEYFDLGIDAYNKEQKIIKKYKQYKSNSVLLKSGNTELFTKNVLNL